LFWDGLEMSENGENITGLHPRVAALVTGAHTVQEVRRCRKCGVRKVLEVAFYRDRSCKGGRRPECKRCRNAYRREWSRRRAKVRQAINRRPADGRATEGRVR
jgi:hypothetical protein